MIPEKMLEVLDHEGLVSIVTSGEEVHVANTWNSYLNIIDNSKILIPVGGMNTTEANLKVNDKVLMTFGSREVDGFRGPGTGFLIVGKGKMLSEGSEFSIMKEQFPWIRAVLVVDIIEASQTL